jgi:hypothetical protein
VVSDLKRFLVRFPFVERMIFDLKLTDVLGLQSLRGIMPVDEPSGRELSDWITYGTDPAFLILGGLDEGLDGRVSIVLFVVFVYPSDPTYIDDVRHLTSPSPW